MLAGMKSPRDLDQVTGDLLQLGRIAAVDLAACLCTVEAGDFTTGPLPWLTFRAGALRTWSAPSIGEQCLLISPEGDAAAGLVVLGLYSDEFPAPASAENLHLLAFDDGAAISYDAQAGALAAILPAGATVTITAPGGATINAQDGATINAAGGVTINAAGGVTINGDVSVSGQLTATGDVVGDGISLASHVHGGVSAGQAKTQAPE